MPAKSFGLRACIEDGLGQNVEGMLVCMKHIPRPSLPPSLPPSIKGKKVEDSVFGAAAPSSPSSPAPSSPSSCAFGFEGSMDLGERGGKEGGRERGREGGREGGRAIDDVDPAGAKGGGGGQGREGRRGGRRQTTWDGGREGGRGAILLVLVLVLVVVEIIGRRNGKAFLGQSQAGRADWVGG